LREERKSHWIPKVERENHYLTLISATKMIDLSVNEFYLIKEVPLNYFFTFKLPKKSRFDIKKKPLVLMCVVKIIKIKHTKKEARILNDLYIMSA
jgi:hypothetical protein